MLAGRRERIAVAPAFKKGVLRPHRVRFDVCQPYKDTQARRFFTVTVTVTGNTGE